jgi:hypothetical protein
VEENLELQDLVAAAFTLEDELQQSVRGALPILVQAASNCIAMEQAQEMIQQNEAIIEQLKIDNEKKDEMIELLQDLRDALTSQSAEDVDDQSEDIHRLALAVGQSLEGLQGALVDKDQLAELPENEQE